MSETAVEYPYPDKPREDILRMIPADGRVIGSIGCGSGATEAVLVGQGREVHGVDVHGPSIDLARPRLTSARAVGPDDADLFASDSLDGLILADVIEHLPLAWERLAAFARYVRPGGWVAISVPNMRSIWMLRQFLWRGDWPEDELGIFDRTHLQVMSEKRLRRWCDLAGLRVETWFDCYPQTTPPRLAAMKTIDRVTFRTLHAWAMVQIQFLCRRTGS